MRNIVALLLLMVVFLCGAAASEALAKNDHRYTSQTIAVDVGVISTPFVAAVLQTNFETLTSVVSFVHSPPVNVSLEVTPMETMIALQNLYIEPGRLAQVSAIPKYAAYYDVSVRKTTTRIVRGVYLVDLERLWRMRA